MAKQTIVAIKRLQPHLLTSTDLHGGVGGTGCFPFDEQKRHVIGVNDHDKSRNFVYGPWACGDEKDVRSGYWCGEYAGLGTVATPNVR